MIGEHYLSTVLYIRYVVIIVRWHCVWGKGRGAKRNRSGNTWRQDNEPRPSPSPCPASLILLFLFVFFIYFIYFSDNLLVAMPNSHLNLLGPAAHSHSLARRSIVLPRRINLVFYNMVHVYLVLLSRHSTIQHKSLDGDWSH
jgi:hypothetical protein